MTKFKKELTKFKEFFKKYEFNQLELIEKEDGSLYYDVILVRDSEGNTLNECEYFINVGYKLKGPLSKVLSNLFPYTFKFKGKKIKSIESVFQGIKFQDKHMQNLVLNYDRLDANNIKIASGYDWKETGVVYWQGKKINRFSSDYDDFVCELYVSAIQNPLYRNILKNNNKYIMHSIGVCEKEKTVFTKYEFEKMLNALSKFLKER